MPKISIGKKNFIDKVNKHFGIKKRYVNILYDFLMESFRESIIESPNVYVEGLGRFSHNTENRLTVDFTASDRLKVEIKGDDWDEFSRKKHSATKKGPPRTRSTRQKRIYELYTKDKE